jgi:hypothetical protein
MMLAGSGQPVGSVLIQIVSVRECSALVLLCAGTLPFSEVLSFAQESAVCNRIRHFNAEGWTPMLGFPRSSLYGLSRNLHFVLCLEGLWILNIVVFA